jgi:hypothetical protein
MYSNAKPVIITNAAAYTSLKLRENLVDPVQLYGNITTNDNVEIGAEQQERT